MVKKTSNILIIAGLIVLLVVYPWSEETPKVIWTGAIVLAAVAAGIALSNIVRDRGVKSGRKTKKKG